MEKEGGGRREEARINCSYHPPSPPTPLSNLQLKSSATNFNLIVRRSAILHLPLRPSPLLSSLLPFSFLFARKRRKSEPSLEICPVYFPKLCFSPLDRPLLFSFLARSLARSLDFRPFIFVLLQSYTCSPVERIVRIITVSVKLRRN